MSQFAVILAAAGMSQRFQDPYYKKVVVPLAGRPLWLYAAETFSNRSDVAQIIMVIAQDDREMFVEKFGGNLALLGAQLVLGGSTRAESVLEILVPPALPANCAATATRRVRNEWRQGEWWR